MSLASGTRLGPYVLESLLGAGGMGEVYRAHDARLNRTVAIKVLSPEVATPERVDRFEQEARAASALNHPNILTIHDVGREGNIAYFAMEWVDGQTLRDLLRAGPIPLRRTIQLTHQIAEGLARAHAAGIIHRDLKPENVMVTADGLAKVVDFGLAKLAPMPGATPPGDNHPTTTILAGTSPGLVLGTVGYMSPEQASGRPVDYRSDQFALGLLIYELVTGTRPFARPTTAQSLAATIEAEPTPIEMVNAETPPHLAAIVARCLAKDPAERYDSTRDLARDLKSIFDGPSRNAISSTTPMPVAIPVSSGRTRSMVIAAALLVVSAAAVAWLWRSAPRAPSAPVRPLVAVRPFRSLSADSAQSYFAAGMTEELRGQLSQVGSLRLLSRNGLDAYKDGDVPRMVRELGVGNFIDGSVRVDGTRVRITAELVDASSNETLWSEQYDRDVKDMLAVQSDVALQIARALHSSLSPHERQRLESRPTENPEAYALYLQSQQMRSLGDRAANLAAIDLLRKALALDPRFATAQARLAYRLVFMGYYDEASYIDRGIAEAEAALRIDPALPDAYFAIGTGYGMKGLDAQARQAFLRALELDPSHVSAMNNFSMNASTFGRLDESLYWARRSFELAGKSANAYYHVAIPLSILRDDEVSRKWLASGQSRFPNFYRIAVMLAPIELLAGRTEEAVSLTNAAVARFPQNEEVRFLRADMAFLTDGGDLEASLEPLMENSASNSSTTPESVRLRYAFVLARRGDTARSAPLLAEAERIAREKIDRGDRTPALRVELAAAAALRRDHGAALQSLSSAFDAGFRDYGFLERDPILAPLRTEPKFREILGRIRSDVEKQRARARERGLMNLDPLLAPSK